MNPRYKFIKQGQGLNHQWVDVVIQDYPLMAEPEIMEISIEDYEEHFSGRIPDPIEVLEKLLYISNRMDWRSMSSYLSKILTATDKHKGIILFKWREDEIQKERNAINAMETELDQKRNRLSDLDAFKNASIMEFAK
jgi:hypothetical protein